MWDEVTATEAEGSWDPEFYKAEWRDVIQAQDVRDEAAYLKARRVGRGTKLRRSERRKVWPVFARFREMLDDRGLVEATEIRRLARRHLEEGDATSPYASVVVDETQDMDAAALRLLRTVAGEEHANDLFLVGDAHQRIYGRPVTLTSCGINVRGRRSRRLRINYRTTDAIRRFAMATLSGETFDDLDEATDDAKGYVSLRSGPEPTVRTFDDLVPPILSPVRVS